MPGVDKNDFKLDMRRDVLCLSAPRGNDGEYSSCFNLSHEVEPEKTEARFSSSYGRENDKDPSSRKGLCFYFCTMLDSQETVGLGSFCPLA